MSFRSKVLLLLIIVAIFGVFALAFLLLSTIPTNNTDVPEDNQNEETPVSNPVSFPNGEDNKEVFKYAFVEEDGKISLLNLAAETIPINIENKSWKNLNWNATGTHIGVLGQTDENTFNLFIFNLASKEWEQVTSFTKDQGGVDGYIWKDSSSILFVQGNVPERWLHSYQIESSETLKLNKVDGNIIRINNEKTRIVFKKDFTELISVYFITTATGEFIYRFDQINDQDGKSIVVSDVLFSEDGDSLLLQGKLGSDVLTYKSFFGSKEAFVIEPEEKNVAPICNVSDNTYLSYRFDGTKLELISINTEGESLTSTVETELENEPKITKALCYDTNNIVLKAEYSDKIEWITLNSDREFISLESLSDNLDVSINSSN